MKSLIHERILQHGPLSFADYMAVALYQPGQGYYAKGDLQVGRGGDFYTSVSVGPLFGQLLARHALRIWQKLGEPSRWRITELGAHDGKLALDILNSLAEMDETAYAAVEYAIPEPLENLRIAQAETLKDHIGQLVPIADASELEALPGIVFGNEILDALPCHVVEMTENGWQECVVGSEGDELAWQLQAISDDTLSSAVEKLGDSFKVGYRTEVRTKYADFLRPLRRSLSQGRMLWVDYGFDRPEYYHPDRHEGTLRTFSHHHAGDDVLNHPGELDISAHVDFTAVAEAAIQLGGKPAPLISQGSWLTHLAKEWLLAQEGQPDAKAMRQFQTLTHPGHLGRSFQVLEVEFS